MKTLREIAADLMTGENPEELARQEGWDRVSDAIDMLEDRE
jgi:hypothetical protein